MSPDDSTKGKREFVPGDTASLLRESLASGVLVASSRGHIAVCTPEAATLLGVKAAHLLEKPVSSLPVPLRELIGETTKSGKPVFNAEIPAKRSSGGKRVLLATVVPVKTHTYSQVIVVLNSLAPESAYEQNMRRLDRLASLGTLSASMAHEIKNGMVAVKTFIDLLLQKGQDTELTDVVNRELQRINAIVTQMLRFASPKPAVFTTVQLHELLDHSLRLLHHQISGKLISLQRRYQAQTDTVHGNEVQLQQAFMNLMLNALEAMDTNGALTVATETTESERAQLIHVHIQDTGVGVAQENMERLFEPFFTTKKNGTGLGLAISQRIAHDHHGMIQARSELSRGSTFSISLPLATA